MPFTQEEVERQRMVVKNLKEHLAGAEARLAEMEAE